MKGAPDYQGKNEEELKELSAYLGAIVSPDSFKDGDFETDHRQKLLQFNNTMINYSS